MKIAFDNVNFDSYSGPNQFAYILGTELEQQNIEIVSSDIECDLQLAFIEQTNYNNKAKLIQRLDGFWFHPDDFKAGKNDAIKRTYEKADGLIFQSEFDKKFIEKYFGKRDVCSTIIRNGTYVTRLEHKQKLKIEWLMNLRKDFDKIFVASSQWIGRPNKRLNEIIELFIQYSEWSKDSCCLILMGETDKFQAKTEIEYRKQCIQINLGNVLPSQAHIPYSFADWMLHLEYAGHCPNVVVQSLASQTPVICSSIGGQAELVSTRGLIIYEDEFNFELCDYRNPLSIKIADKHFKHIKNGLLLHKKSIEDVKIQNIAQQYISFFKKVLNEE